jgi:hypothetical protein
LFKDDYFSLRTPSRSTPVILKSSSHMSIEFLSFLVGSVLIGVAIIGGGFELKELKMPRVGVAVRLVSLGAGLAFIVLALGLYAVAHPELAAGGGAAPVAKALVDPASADTTASVAAEAVAQPASDAVAAAPDAASTEFGGFGGTSVLTWYVGQAQLTGVLKADGQTGIVTVTWTDETGQQVSVDEDLQLQQDEQGIRYLGSNPRFSGTSTGVENYQPDYFTIVPVDGEWAYSQACDAARGCSPVEMQPVG